MVSEEEDQGIDPLDPTGPILGLKTERLGPLPIPLPNPRMDDIGKREPWGSGGGEEMDEPDAPVEAMRDHGESTMDADQSSQTEHFEVMENEAELTSIEQAAELGDEYIDAVERAMGEESCELCKQILQNLREFPLDEQVKGVRELAQLKREAGKGADPVELAELMDDFEVIADPHEML